MSEGYQLFTALGNIGRDPELKYGQTGSAVLKFSLAINKSFKNKNDELVEKTTWISCVMFGKRAEGLGKVLKMGDKIFITGEIEVNKYEKNGETRYSTDIVLSEVCFANGGKRDGETRNEAEPRQQTRSAPKAAKTGPVTNAAADIPFGGADEIPF